MAIGGTLVTLAVSILITGYLFYALVPVPLEIEQSDDVFWIFLKRKVIRALSIISEYLGQGPRIVLARYFSSTSLLTLGETANVKDIKITGKSFDGVPVRIYDPKNRVDNSPAFFWIHGGGWTTGSAEADDVLATEFARRLQILVVSVNYRLAPEHVFPAAFDDCFTAMKYFLDHAKEFKVDPHRVAIGGASAGGNLAAAVSLKLWRTQNKFQPSIQVLFVPCLQAFDFNTPSYQQHANSPFLPKYWMISYWLWYAHGPYDDRRRDEYAENLHTSPEAKVSEFAKFVDHGLVARKYFHTSYAPNEVNHGNRTLWNEVKGVFLDPYFAPLMADDLTGLPQAYIAVAGFDVLRDDGLMYGRRLVDSGVPVEMKHYQEGYHALTIRFDHFNLSKRVMMDLEQYLSSKL